MAETNNVNPILPPPATSFVNPFSSSMTTIVNIKLDRANYPLWLAQILPILKSRDLMGYVDGSLDCPPKHLAGNTAVNPEYVTWVQRDQMVLSWINGSLTASVLATVASKRISRATWEALEQRYASTSHNRILFLRNELLLTKKAQARDTPITYPTLEALLLTTERRMMEQVVPVVEATPVNAFVAARGRGGFPSNRGGASPINQRGFFPRNTNQRNPAVDGECFNTSGERITCQICGKPGHPALDCYQRMNGAYEGRIPTKRLTAMASSPITLNRQQNGTWLLDTGANAHVTPDIQNLVNPKEYNGNENIGGVGNDTGLSIKHYGSNKISTKACSFELNNILHCPSASTSLISAHKFTLDNHCYLLIFPHFFLVKDLKTQKTLFQGRCENGLYPFPGGGGLSQYPISMFLGVRVSAKKMAFSSWSSCVFNC
ncbi:hypothetical protein D8674_006698 [Pyrus ussuriensis x Pyrus communis]|uniref:CCHC-type domain-containing protein n=1 Tax=Pyrus ussuriensis x Pyrus communis TaxID=2448454 RepID=A0A5N5FZG8_9ROSA|nr:hypothetical protein D8674_006698 [Pyrus ussuriensis x Pyrus communis]